MKKYLSLILAVCLALLLTVPAFADGRGPEFSSYEIVCPGDTPYYRENWDDDEEGTMEKQGSFPAGTTLTVEYEYETDGVLYGEVSIEDNEDIGWAYVRLSDVAMKDKAQLPDKSQKLTHPQTVRVVEKGGIPMFAGPNKKFDTITTIPRGTKLTFTFGNDPERAYRTWAYVSYLNHSGWIYVYAFDMDNGLAELPETDDAKIWVLQDGVRMFSGTSFGNIEDAFRDNWDEEELAKLHEAPDRAIKTLEKGRQYPYRYSRSGELGYTWYYIVSGLHAGWVPCVSDEGKIAVPTTDEQQCEYMTFEPMQVKLHETPDDSAPSVTVRIDRDTVLTPTYVVDTEDGRFSYLTSGGQSGWYAYSETSDHCAFILDEEWSGDEGYKNENDRPAPIYSDIRQKGTPIGYIPANGAFTPLYRGDYSIENPEEEYDDWVCFYYVRVGDVTGWVDIEDLQLPDEEETVTEPEETTDEVWDEEDYADETDAEDDLWEEEEFVPEDAAVSSVGLRPMQIVIACIIGAAVLALTAAVTLLLIRRRRKAKNTDGSGGSAAE